MNTKSTLELNCNFLRVRLNEARREYEVAESIFNNTTDYEAQMLALTEMDLAKTKMNTVVLVSKKVGVFSA